MLERPAYVSRWTVSLVGNEALCFVSARDERVLLDEASRQVGALIDGRRSAARIAERLAAVLAPERTLATLIAMERAGFIVERPREKATVAGKRVIESLARRTFGMRSRNVRVVHARDYCDASRDAVNRRMLREARSWMLVRSLHDELWIGPLFVPGETACWRCLADRMSGNRPVSSYLRECSAPRRELARGAAASVTATRAISRQLRMWRRTGTPLPGCVVVFDATRRVPEVHVVERRPQCPACGHASRGVRRPSVSAWRLLANPVAGITAGVRKLSGHFHIYVANPIRMGALESVEQLCASLSARCAGSAFTERDALRAALGETVERHCQIAHGDEPRVRSSLSSLGARGIDPTSVLLFSQRQYGSGHAPVRFDTHRRIDWTSVQSLSANEERCLPTAMLYFGSGIAGGEMLTADTNGCAAGITWDDAVTRGFLELVERDSIALWWYNRASRPGLRLPAEHRALADTYRKLGRDVALVDITSDLGVPVVVAISQRMNHARAHVLFGFAAHFDQQRAIARALCELNQVVGTLATIREDDYGRVLPATFASWLAKTDHGDQPHLRPAPVTTPAGIANPGRASMGECLRVATRAGLEVFALDLTRRDIGIPVAKVIVPGLRPAVPRFAAGRLYDAPCAMGWQPERLRERQLNSVPFFL